MFNLALLLQRGSRHKEAAEYWRQYLANDAESEWAARARRSLKFCEMQVYLSDVLTFAVERGRVRRCDSRPVAASLHRVRGRRPARRAGLRPLRLHARHHRHRWDLAVVSRCL